MIKRCAVVLSLFIATITSYADVRNDAISCAMAYYSSLQKYAQNPADLDLEDRIKRFVIDGKGSVYNDIYTNVLNKKETSSDIGNYLAEIGGYKNRNGYCLHIEVVESSLSYVPNDSSSGYVTATKRVYCNYGRQLVDYTIRERLLIRNGRIVNITKAKSEGSHLSVSPSTVSLGSDGGNRTLSVRTDGVWRISSVSSSWLHATSSGNDLLLKVDKNETSSSRSSSVKIVSGNLEETVSVSQNGKSVSSTNKGGEFSSFSASVIGDNVVCKMTFNLLGMKEKKGRVVCYFYDSASKALQDKNGKYDTASGTVCSYKDITPKYDNTKFTDLEISIPISELHLESSSPQTIKVYACLWDYSVEPNKSLCSSSWFSLSVSPISNNVSKSAKFNSISASVVGDNVVCKLSFDVSGMKEKKGRAVCYFYDSSGDALKDKNDGYCTIDGHVSCSETITPNYDNTTFTDLEVSIPVAELHLVGSSPQTIKVDASLWDYSVEPHKSLCSSSWYTFTVTPISNYLKIDNSSSDINRSISDDGKSEYFNVSTSDNSFDIWGLPSWCKIESQTATGFRLVVEKNTSSSSRSDYFKVQAAGKEIRFNISQEGCTGPSTVINRFWVEHNTQYTGYNTIYNPYLGWQQIPSTYYGMRIHVDFEVNNMKGKSIRVCAFFFDKNGNKMRTSNNQFRTPDGQVTVQGVGDAIYDNSHWDNFILDIPYSVMKRGDNKFYIQIQNSSGNTLETSSYEYFSVK